MGKKTISTILFMFSTALALLILAVICIGCISKGNIQLGNNAEKNKSIKETENQSIEKSSQAKNITENSTWPEWSGPKSLGPGKNLAELWYVQFLNFPEKDSAHCYKIHVTSEGNWGDTINDKGTITSDELECLKTSLAAIDWEKIPQLKEEDYIAYTEVKKTWPITLLDCSYYEVKFWLGQTNCSPEYDAKTIIADLIAPCAPEIKKLIEVLKPLQEKYEPEIH